MCLRSPATPSTLHTVHPPTYPCPCHHKEEEEADGGKFFSRQIHNYIPKVWFLWLIYAVDQVKNKMCGQVPFWPMVPLSLPCNNQLAMLGVLVVAKR